ncbi:hypothetical protein IV203_007717 [Nitzschia inconspicua]|uniref:Uncharacterized protein n=1 Tax=Nitzschia inconspicua TaxID=303405 RepID=A0A9K3KYE0_9STRA|nr:hypothetical protein IV203_007717 [Nitzschia inconspicua]
MKFSSSSLMVLLLAAATSISFIEAAFEEVETNLGNVTPTGVVFPSICIGRVTVPKVMYTLEPSNTFSVSTDPPDLVEVGIDPTDGLVYFKFLPDTLALNPTAAGVIVQFPSTGLQSINICCGQELQVKDGFTNVESLVVSAGATAQAVFSTNNVDFEITVREAATATVEVNAARNSDIVVSGSGSGTFVDIAGDITSIECTDRATCSVAGSISDTAASSVEGFAILDTEECNGISVNGGSTCDESFPFVSANVDGSLTISGVTEQCLQGGDLDGNIGGTTPTVSIAPTPEGFTPPPTPTPFPTAVRPTSSPIARPTSSPTTITVSSSAVTMMPKEDMWTRTTVTIGFMAIAMALL